MKNILKIIDGKKQLLSEHQPFSQELTTNLNEWYKIELTYTSNAIEGNTLSRVETAQIIEKGITVEGKTLTEHLEAVNHAEAFDWVLKNIGSKKKVNQDAILNIHRIILQRIVDNQAGRYRSVPVRIAGSTVVMPNPQKVPKLMEEFVAWLQTTTDHPVKVAADAHFKLVSIHPFVDGNGRTARLLMNLLLMQAGFPPAIIRKEDRKKYIASIEKAQLGGSLSNYYELMYASVDKSLDVYLESLEEKNLEEVLKEKLTLKIGELAKLTGESVPTIRHWTNKGLLEVSSYSKGGYQLYGQEQVEIMKKIKNLQKEERLTLSEIRQRLLR